MAGKRTALVLSGGGANGAYEVGAAGYLLGELGIDPEIVTGTSVGALNGALISQFPLGRPLKAARALFDVWHRLAGNDDVYRPNVDLPMGLAADLLGPLPMEAVLPSVYDTEPLRRLVEGSFDASAIRSSGREFVSVAVSLNSGGLGVWREHDPDLVEGVMASSAFPVMFPPVKARGSWWVDGGVRDVLPIRQALELGAERVFAIVTEPERPAQDPRSRFGLIDVALRCLGLLVDEVLASDVAIGRQMCEDAGVELTIIRPKASLGDSFDFSRKKNHGLIVQGDADARRFLP